MPMPASNRSKPCAGVSVPETPGEERPHRSAASLTSLRSAWSANSVSASLKACAGIAKDCGASCARLGVARPASRQARSQVPTGLPALRSDLAGPAGARSGRVACRVALCFLSLWLLEGFAEELCQAGYAKITAHGHIRAAEHLLYWTDREGLPISGFNEQVLEHSWGV
ncbi:MAG: hypothetical protein ACRENW_02250 [Thermodesulfobacteriota bacterium]